MTKRFALMLMLLLPLLAGCLTDSGDDDDDNDNGSSGGGAQVTASELMPLKTGATYAYTETDNYPWNDEAYVSSYTSTIGGQASMFGKSYYTMIDAYEGWTDSTYFRIADNTLYSLETFWGVIAARMAEKAGRPVPKTAEDTEQLIEVPFVKFNSSSWTIYTGTVSNEYHTTQMNWTGKYVGTQSVTVPAGTFENCEVYEITMNDYTTFDYEDDTTYEETYIVTMTIWFAPNVGNVKSVSQVDISGIDGVLEDNGNTVAELTSYSIP